MAQTAWTSYRSFDTAVTENVQVRVLGDRIVQLQPDVTPLVVMTVNAKKKKATKARKTSSDRELTARATALINMTRADCLSGAVDKKLDWDVNTNTVHDLGNVITAPVCSAYKLPNANTMAQAKAFIQRQDLAKSQDKLNKKK